MDLDRQVYGYATLGEICYRHPTRDDRDKCLSRLQRQINNLAAGPPTADSEKDLKGLIELHECVSLLPTSSMGWSDKSYPNIGGCSDECASEIDRYNDECASEIDNHYDDCCCWLEEDSLDSVMTEESFLDDKTFLDDESFLS